MKNAAPAKEERPSGGWFTKFWKHDLDATEDAKKADVKYSPQVSATEGGFVKNYRRPPGPKPRRPTEPEYVDLSSVSVDPKWRRRAEVHKERVSAAVESRSTVPAISRWQNSGRWSPLAVQMKQRPSSVTSMTAVVDGDTSLDDKSSWPEVPDILEGDILENYQELPAPLRVTDQELADYCEDDAQPELIAELEAPGRPEFVCVVEPPSEPPRQQDDARLSVNDAWQQMAKMEKKRARRSEREVEDLVKVAAPVMAAIEMLRDKEGLEGILEDDSYEGVELLLEKLLEDRDASKKERDYYLARWHSSKRKQQALQTQLDESRQ